MSIASNLTDRVFIAYKEFKQRRETERKIRITETVCSWYETCVQISETCGETLYNAGSMPDDIGQVLDSVDLKLFRLRDSASDTLKAVKSHDRNLARQVESVTQLVYKLRNETTSFLLRAQGPGIFALDQAEDDGLKHWYYLRALDHAGFKARDLKKKLDKDLKILWNELEKLLRMAYSPAIHISGIPG